MNPGDLLDGRYEIAGRLGAGGMGEVYKATHVLLGTPRVLKIVHPRIVGSEDAHERFVREARIATRVQHPNVATLHDFASLPDGAHYMVWEFIEGENLAQRLRTRGVLPPRHAVAIIIQALRGLEAIHRAGIVHRDISPENLMITPRDEVKIIDLGVAKLDDPDAVSSTRTGVFVGKLRYAAPEQLGFLPEGETIDGRADLYAIAMVLFELLAGRPPYEATSPHEYFLHHAREIKQPNVDLPAGLPARAALQHAIEKALSRDRNDRFASAAEFASALERIERALRDEMESATAIVPQLDFADPEAKTESLTAPGSARTDATLRKPLPGEEATVLTPLPNEAPTLLTPLPEAAAPPPPPAAVPRTRGAWIAVLLVAVFLVVAAGAAYALRPRVSAVLASLGIANTPPTTSTAEAPPIATSATEAPIDSTQVTELFDPRTPPPVRTETATHTRRIEPAAAPPPSTKARITQPAVEPGRDSATTGASSTLGSRPSALENDDEPVRPPVRRVAVYVDGPGRSSGNERALDVLREEMRGVTSVSLLAGGFQVDVYRAINRYLPDLTFDAGSDVVIRFDATDERLRRQGQHLAAAATITKNGRVVFRYELPSYVDRRAAAEAFAQTLSDAFVE